MLSHQESGEGEEEAVAVEAASQPHEKEAEEDIGDRRVGVAVVVVVVEAAQEPAGDRHTAIQAQTSQGEEVGS